MVLGCDRVLRVGMKFQIPEPTFVPLDIAVLLLPRFLSTRVLRALVRLALHYFLVATEPRGARDWFGIVPGDFGSEVASSFPLKTHPNNIASTVSKIKINRLIVSIKSQSFSIINRTYPLLLTLKG